MKRICIALLATGLISPLFGMPRPAPGNYAFDAEFIYFHPLVEQSSYEVQTPGTGETQIRSATGSIYENDLRWQAGYRLGAIYAFCNGTNDVEFRWTQLNTSSTDSHSLSSGAFLLPTQGFPQNDEDQGGTIFLFQGTGSSQISIDYYAIDGLFTQTFCPMGCFDLQLQAGVHYAHFEYKENILYDNPGGASSVVENKDRFWGVGPEFVLNMDYALCNCWCNSFPLYITGNLRTALLVSDSKANFYAQTIGNTVLGANVNKALWRIVPMWDLRLGLDWSTCFSCFTFDLEIGYEVLQYVGAVHTIRFYSDNLAGASFNLFSNLGYHGPYLACRVQF